MSLIIVVPKGTGVKCGEKVQKCEKYVRKYDQKARKHLI